jgi:SAM-dependent methyltransferase
MEYDFYMKDGIGVSLYDQMHPVNLSAYDGDIEFFINRAELTGDPVLELGCGTGRVTWEMAKAGFNIVGLDISNAMLSKAEEKRQQCSDDVNQQIRFVQGDMVDFLLNMRFRLIIIPFRAWMVITSPKRQRRSLEGIREHLEDDGTLIINNFDPRLDMCTPGVHDRSKYDHTVKHPVSGNDVMIQITHHINDTLNQTLMEKWKFTEKDAKGKIVREEEETLLMRWTYRWEMMYLFELCGFEVVEEYSDFRESPPDYGKEQIWIVRKK